MTSATKSMQAVWARGGARRHGGGGSNGSASVRGACASAGSFLIRRFFPFTLGRVYEVLDPWGGREPFRNGGPLTRRAMGTRRARCQRPGVAYRRLRAFDFIQPKSKPTKTVVQ